MPILFIFQHVENLSAPLVVQLFIRPNVSHSPLLSGHWLLEAFCSFLASIIYVTQIVFYISHDWEMETFGTIFMLLLSFIHLAFAIAAVMLDQSCIQQIGEENNESFIWNHKTMLHSQSNHGHFYWFFNKNPSNYNTRLRIMQHVMLTLAPRSCFILYPVERGRRMDRERERKRGHAGSFWVSLSRCETNVKLWQKCDGYLQCQNLSGSRTF